jgi:glycine oxidase
MSSAPRIAIIGSGIVGLSSALHLAQSGCEVSTFDGNKESSEASWAAAGMLAPHNEADETTPLWKLCSKSLELWPAFAQSFASAEALDLHFNGSWIPCFNHEERRAHEQKMKHFQAEGVDFQWLEPGVVLGQESAINPNVLGAYAVEGGHVDPRKVCAELVRACQGLGVHCHYQTQVKSIEDGQLTLMNGTTETFDHIVLAAGAWTPQLAELTGLKLEGEPVKGQMLRFEAHPEIRLTRFLHCELAYAVQRRDGSVVIGSTMEYTGFDKQENEQSISKLVAGARQLLPYLNTCDVQETWTGLRPKLEGGTPLFKRIHSKLTLATGHFRNGVLLTPISGQIVRDLVLKGASELLESTLGSVQRTHHLNPKKNSYSNQNLNQESNS